LRTTIDAFVQADPYKFYTYTQYQNSLTTNIAGGGPPGSTIPGLQNLMDARATFFSTNSNYTLVAPTISAHGSSNNSPVFGESIYLTATCSNETTVYLGYRSNHQLKFNRVQMFDDGVHGDGAAGDHVYGYQITIDGAILEYFIYSENSNAGIFSPQRAEHEYHSLTISIPFCNVGDVLINELVASNGSSAFDSNAENDDWVELYNTTASAIDLSGMYLSDDALNMMKWFFPIGTSIPANGFLMVWCDNDMGQAGLHTNFKLSSLGENLIFSNGATTYDQVIFGVQSTDVAYARCPDGGATFSIAIPTPLATNNCQASIYENPFSEIRIYPNPFNSDLTINGVGIIGKEILIYDLMGRQVFQGTIDTANFIISGNSWDAGVYSIRLSDTNGFSFEGKIIKI
jgi:hypothetical protein